MHPAHALTDADRARITAAVTAAEAHTSGEIVTVLADRSDSYEDIALVWSALVALLALTMLALFPRFYLGLVDAVMGGWSANWHPGAVLVLATTVAAIKFSTMWLLQLWRPLRLWLVPGAVKHRRVRAHAITCFRLGAERRTTGSTAVLIYLSGAERRAEIVVDAGIAAKVEPEVWGAAMHAMLTFIRDGQLADGLIAATERVGAVLAEHFPRAGHGANQIPNQLIEV